MDKRKTSILSHDGKVSQAYLHERSILRKRLDQFQREQDKSIKKISDRQETLANAFAAEIGKNQTMETSLVEINSLRRRSRADTISSLDSRNPESTMEIYPRLRKTSVPSDRKWSTSGETRGMKKAIRQISDPLQPSSQTSDEIKAIITFPRRKLTTGQIDLSVSSKEFRHQSVELESHIFKSNLSKNQKRPSANFLSAKLPRELANRHFSTPLSNSKSERDYSMGKMNFPTRLFLSSNTPSRMVNETGAEEKNKYIKDSLTNVSKKVLDNRRKTSHGNSTCSPQEIPNVSNDKIKPQESKESKIIQKITPGDLITKGQFQNTELKANDVYLSGESSIAELETSAKLLESSELNVSSRSDQEFGTGSESDKSASTKASFSEDKSKRNLHALTSSAVQQAGAMGGVCRLGNAWTDNKISARRKISIVEAPQGIIFNDNSSALRTIIPLSSDNSSVSSTEVTSKVRSSTSETGSRNIDALRSFRKLALLAVAAERFRAEASKPNSENRKIVLPERKVLTKARLEELQRPTESYLRQIVAEEMPLKMPNVKTRSRSLSQSNSGTTSASGITKFRRASQAAMATRILIDREHRKVSGSGFSHFESRKETNQGKTLAEMMNELKNCRYLRNSTMDDE